MRAAALVLTATVLIAACGDIERSAVGRNEEAAPTPSAPGAPPVDIGAFAGLGELAFDWRDALWILDGTSQSLQRIDDAGGALSWSPSGEWLAYTKPRGGLVDLWVVRADGSARRRVAPDAKDLVARWSPTADVLSVGVLGPSGGYTSWIATPASPARPLSQKDAAAGMWSADGTALIYATVLPFTRPEDRDDALWTLSMSGGAPRQWIVVRRAGIVLDSPFRDDRGVLLRQDPQHANSAAADGLPLSVYRFGDLAPRELPVVAVGKPRWLPDGHSVVLLTGLGRFIWNNKQLTRCDVTAMTCASLVADPASAVVEPAVSPDGSRVAFIRAPERGFTGFAGQKALADWNAARRLWAGPLDAPHELAALGGGVFDPEWAPDSRHLLFIRDDAAWLTDDTGTAPRKLLSDLGLTAQPWSLYWPHAWHRGPAQPRRPVGFTLPSGCTFANDGVRSGARYLWVIDCGADRNAHAAAALGPAFASQGWTVCAGSGSPTWLKDDYALTVTDGNATSRGYIGLTQSPRQIVSCR